MTKCGRILSAINLFPWQVFANNPQSSQTIALRSSQGDLFTWADVAQKINQTAAFLQQRGITPQSTIAFCAKNSEAVLFLYLASLQCGAKIIGLNPAFPKQRIDQFCREYGVDLCLRNEDLAKISECSFAKLEEADFLRPATMTLTSGSGGLPKAVLHNVQAHLDNARGVCQLMQFHATQSWLLSLPLYHVSGQGIVWRWLVCGAQLHFPQTDFYASL